ncbi:MAG TPA: DeoR/GlpR family DNA-binding transcription regulator [Kiritimatiellia bacterium]|nr:DeoR/GlpR family DNA-binding transcription regulator [Kiritimatiellia bacterium]HMO98342.1 DeoR/GlpR family DNA-binding transcription regulator [Kiritimatiellia bacterium]HMP95462.1 DeoR/GlpR family DNA-binding transcription regulator [Kiritimatiellia bacterium]
MISTSKDLAPARQTRLLDVLRTRGSARVEDICRELGASPATVRRDLEFLEKQGRLRRVHGGAVSLDARLHEPLFDDKTALAPAEKLRIADRAIALVKPGDTVYLDGGSTVLELARKLVDRSDITVVTNSLKAAAELSGRGPRLILVGGELRRLSQTIVGPLTTSLLNEVHVDIAFMGTMGITLAAGLTTSDPGEAFTKRLVMTRARRVVLLADSGKVGITSFAHAGNVRDLHVFITDKNIKPSDRRAFQKAGIELITA